MKIIERIKRIRATGLILLVFLILVGCDGKIDEPVVEEYRFKTNGMELSVGEDADGVISRMMEPNFSSTAPSCAGIGQDEVYIYNGFKINVYREGEEAEIVSIEVTNDTLPTSEGIYIGDVEARLREVYGEGRPFAGGVEYFGERCTLRFYLKEGKVTAIKYMKTGS